MPSTSKKKAIRQPTLNTLNRELSGLRAQVEELEDLRDLNSAIARNGNKAGVAWEKARASLNRS